MREKSEFEIVLGMDRTQLQCFHVTLLNAHRNWPGGDPREQEILKYMRDASWKLLLEAQFEG